MRGIAVIALLFAGGLMVALAPAQSQTPAGAWTQKAPMPAVRGEVAAAAVGDKLFALGGGVAGKAVPRNEEYDPVTDRWRPRAPLPQALYLPGFGVINGKFYVAGGYTETGNTAALEFYDPATNGWTTRAPMPTARRAAAGVVLNGLLYVIGGLNAAARR